jgi:hypothetical protein
MKNELGRMSSWGLIVPGLVAAAIIALAVWFVITSKAGAQLGRPNGETYQVGANLPSLLWVGALPQLIHSFLGDPWDWSGYGPARPVYP